MTDGYKATLDTAARGLINKLNNATFEGEPMGCVVLEGMAAEQSVSANGSSHWTVDFRFNIRVVRNDAGDTLSWNHVFDDQTGAWREVKRNDGEPLFHSGDFSTLYS